jgi:hypothetical protein
MYAKTLENLFMCMLIDQYCILSYAATQYAHGNCSLVEVTFEHITWRFPKKENQSIIQNHAHNDKGKLAHGSIKFH